MPTLSDAPALTLLEFSKGEESTLAERVYESLLQAILNNVLRAGDVVSVVKLSSQLGVSRTPVHEAIRQLVSDGLVIQEPNRRPVIASFSGEDVRDVYDMRLLLECEAAARSATGIEVAALQGLREELETLASTPRDSRWLRRWADHDAALHEAIAVGSGSPRLAEDIRRYRRLHHGFNSFYTDAHVLGQAIDEHRKILDALEAHDVTGARIAMERHLREWQAYFTKKVGQSVPV